MAHLVCITHGKRSVVLSVGTRPMPVIRHRTNHDSKCDSILLTTNGRIVSPQEVIESRYDSGVTQWIADRDYNSAMSKVMVDLNEAAPVEKLEADISSLKAKLEGKWKNRPLKRVGRRSK